jgi:uncharacterized protein YkwD
LLLTVLLRYPIVIGIGRRSGPLLVGLTVGALLVGVVALARPAAVRPAELVSSPSAASTTDPPAPARTPATGTPTTGPGGRAVAGEVPADRAAPAGRATPATTPARPSRATSPAPAQAPAAGGSQAAQVVALTNQARAKAGCAALRVDSRLTAAAQGHSADMAANGYFEHDGLDGSSFADRIEAQGYPSPGGENIAQGQQDARAVVTAWLNSSGHRANIENCSFTTIGVGLAGADKYWTQDFGR